MIKNILSLKGVKKLTKKELTIIEGGIIYTVQCDYPNGEMWSGQTQDEDVAFRMWQHCHIDGGTSTDNLFH